MQIDGWVRWEHGWTGSFENGWMDRKVMGKCQNVKMSKIMGR